MKTKVVIVGDSIATATHHITAPRAISSEEVELLFAGVNDIDREPTAAKKLSNALAAEAALEKRGITVVRSESWAKEIRRLRRKAQTARPVRVV